MERKKLSYIALVITIIYGGLFAVVGDDVRTTYAVVGAIVVAVSWVSVGMLGRDDETPGRG
ncbi:hypothetical protein [Ornithinimicrobium cavernae]|uniref:hypothetical protein n=1 Tax=Ornithinimicrobium cavernae TaxID=2666047 RepID=UPI000D691C44|nr:hypothetical protein [Ornithinimicrobium cavernae]